jgi:hypothetical protein
MLRLRLIVIIGITSLALAVPAERARAVDSEVFSKLSASRAALLAQEREIQRSSDDIARQIDDLQHKQSLLDGYARETQSAIREIDRAMSGQ